MVFQPSLSLDEHRQRYEAVMKVRNGPHHQTIYDACKALGVPEHYYTNSRHRLRTEGLLNPDGTVRPIPTDKPVSPPSSNGELAKETMHAKLDRLERENRILFARHQKAVEALVDVCLEHYSPAEAVKKALELLAD